MLSNVFTGTHLILRRCVLSQWRLFSSQVTGSTSNNDQTEGERYISNKLRERFPGATEIDVSDISGGCGAMFEISVKADEFKNKRTMAQHRLVNEALGAELKRIHGVRIHTSIPET